MITPYMQIGILLLIGLLAITYALLQKDKLSILKTTGEKAEGIIFKQDSTRDYNGRTSSVKDKVTIRFVTNKQEWITEDINQPFALFYTWQYKGGEKIIVYYDPDTPTNFYVDKKQSVFLARLLLAITGMGLTAIGIYKLFTTSI